MRLIRAKTSSKLTILLCCVSFLLTAGSSPAVAQKKKKAGDNVVKKALNWLFDPVEEVEVEEAAAVDEVFMFAQPQVAANGVNKEKRKQRLIEWSTAMKEWINSIVELTDEQNKQLDGVYEKAVDSAQKTWNAAANNNNKHRALSDYFVIKFTDKYGAAYNIDLSRSRTLAELEPLKLTDDQKKKLLDAFAERRKFLRSCNAGYICNILDRQLFLTAKQRSDARDVLIKSYASTLDSACYAFQLQNYYFQQTSLATIARSSKIKTLLSDAQANRVKDLSVANRTYISFMSNTMSEWPEQLKTEMKTQQARMVRAVDVRVAFHQTNSDLNAAQARHLTLAGKGATEEVLKAWKRTSLQALKRNEEQAAQFAGQNVGFSIVAINVTALDKNQLWNHTIKKLSKEGGEAAEAREKSRRRAMATFIVGMIDKELWLRKEQRLELINALEPQLPSPDYQRQSYSYYEELSLLLIPIQNYSRKDLACLTPAQTKAWQLLKKPININGRYASIPTKQGGNFSVMVPR